MSTYQLGETVGIRVDGNYAEGEVTLILQTGEGGKTLYTVTIAAENSAGERFILFFRREEHEITRRVQSEYEQIFHPRADE